MGRVYLVKCDHCGYQQQFNLGVGMAFPYTYDKIVKTIKNGEYGDEFKEFFDNHKGAVVDVQTELYRCSECNRLDQDYNLSLYVHKEDKEPEYGIWYSWSDKEDYIFVKSFSHICSECGKRMHIVRESELHKLICPECGESLAVRNDIMWD